MSVLVKSRGLLRNDDLDQSQTDNIFDISDCERVGRLGIYDCFKGISSKKIDRI